MTADELRECFLEFFEAKGHKRFPSQSLVPPNDPSLLFSNAGMNQFKERFQGLGDKKLTRACSAQKCLRTGDIDNVGVTAYHHSFFEMLGNFSFGDYFKEEAIDYAWEFLTKELAMDPARLTVSVYTDDDEAADLWHKKIGLPTDRIVRLGEKENFWPASAPSKGPNGPCGPCSEIFYDMGEQYACNKPGCGVACDCPRWVEIYNLVFMQYERKDDGVLDPLPSPCIDTGMGLERTLATLNGKLTSFDTDLFVPIIEKICEIGQFKYDKASLNGALIRRIADHARAVTLCIHDGVTPSNEGRGYVVRKLLRRVLADGRELGMRPPLLSQLVPNVVQIMRKTDPELVNDEGRIRKLVLEEENKFGITLDDCTDRFEEIAADLKAKGLNQLSGREAFLLHDTYGIPISVTTFYLEGEGISIDQVGFEKEMRLQQERSRAGSNITKEVFGASVVAEIRGSIPTTEFVGYDATESEAKIQAIIQDDAVVDKAKGGEVTLIFDRTPFYAESGGQVADTGTATGKSLDIRVQDVQADGEYYLHRCEIAKGSVKKGDTVTLQVDVERRRAIMRNHTATHIMHAALRTIVGTHVQQAGSLVEAERLRFDFTQPTGLTDEQVGAIEQYVNERIMANTPVDAEQTTLAAAKEQGAMALFSEKYGDTVRLLHVGDFSHELCGGTHVKKTGDIGHFVITQETSISAGTRRIEAITGQAALERRARDSRILTETCRALKTSPAEIVERAEKLLNQIKELKRAKPALSSGVDADALIKAAEAVGDAQLVVARLDDGTDPQALRQAADAIRKKSKKATAVFLAAANDKSVNLIAALTADLVKQGLSAANVIKEIAPIVGGGGGGRPEMAQAGGKDKGKLDDAVAAAGKLLRETLA